MSAPVREDVRPAACRSESARLAARVANCVPPEQPAFLKLLALLEIRASREVRTACVTTGARSRLLLNPDFVAANCPTDRDLRTLVMHELFHVLLGHTRLYRLVTPARNWAFDALINAQLSQLFPDPEDTALFRRLYAADRLPEALLRPPPGWRTSAESWPLEGVAGQVHRALYSERQATEAEILALLESTLDGAACDLGKLLGNHENPAVDAERCRPGARGVPPGDERVVGIDPDLFRTLRQIAQDLEVAHGHGHNRGPGGSPRSRRIEPRSPRRRAVAVIRRALLPLLDPNAGTNGALRPGEGRVDDLLPRRSRYDRRAAVHELLGETPLLYRAPGIAPTFAPGAKVHLYLDVSGSMTAVLPLLYGALLGLESFLHEKLHLFSTKVRDIPLSALRYGVVRSTGETSIACVTDHMVTNRVRRALVLTDGWVGGIPDAHRDALRRCRVGIVLTANGRPYFAYGTGWQVERLPPL